MVHKKGQNTTAIWTWERAPEVNQLAAQKKGHLAWRKYLLIISVMPSCSCQQTVVWWTLLEQALVQPSLQTAVPCFWVFRGLAEPSVHLCNRRRTAGLVRHACDIGQVKIFLRGSRSCVSDGAGQNLGIAQVLRQLT